MYKADHSTHTEHVLRPSASASANLASRSSARSLRPPIAAPLALAAPYKRPSPTPSIKRGKAERLLKEHGSPPGMRVTAGGRVVPSDLPPLGTSRYPDNSFNPPSLRVTQGNIMSAQTQSTNNDAPRIVVVNGQPVIYVGDRMFALPAVNANPTTSLTGNAMDPVTKQASDPPTLNSQGSMSAMSYGPPRTSSTSPFAGLDLVTLKAQQTLKKQELRTVEQTEVLQASHQTDAWRTVMIEKKRCLIVELDALRKSITALENENATNNSFLAPMGSAPGSAPLPTFVPQLQQSVAQAMYPFPATSPYASMMMYQPQFGGFPGFASGEPTPFIAPPPNPPHSPPGSASRRSHAIEIKPPQEGTTRQLLNPKSPTYEPFDKSASARSIAPPTPSPPKRSLWNTQEDPPSDRAHQRASSRKPSFSSIDTTDFFPTNTHEHSSTRLAPRTGDSKQASTENTAAPTTPEKHWPASPWNEANSGRSKNNEPASKLTSWPEAFGKQQSSSSLRQSIIEQSSTVALERAPVMGAYLSTSARSNNVTMCTDSDRGTGTEENLPFSRKAVAHVPSTYQEGYQAGYDHVGMPDNPDVLEGFAQGLLHFLCDQSKKDRLEAAAQELYVRGMDSCAPSLRGLVAGSMPHDSAVSMGFNRNGAPSANYENCRVPKDTMLANVRRNNTHSPPASVKDNAEPRNTFSENVYAPRHRNTSDMQSLNAAGMFPDRPESGRQVGVLSGGNDVRFSTQDKGSASRADQSLASSGFSRQFSGAQIQNRGYGTPLSSQRFYPAPKEMSPNGFGGESVHSMRPFADHRMSGLDGAMDDLADLVMDTQVNEPHRSVGQPSTCERSTQALMPAELEVGESEASCFKPSGGKGKQKVAASPSKCSGNGRDNSVTSPAPPNSPKKSGELSPAKAKLEQVTNKFRRNKKDDPRTMSPEDKMRRSEKWRQRFQAIKRTELEEIEEHHRNTRS
jgi:hypothetical protein